VYNDEEDIRTKAAFNLPSYFMVLNENPEIDFVEIYNKYLNDPIDEIRRITVSWFHEVRRI
jgi:hypothetical protein